MRQNKITFYNRTAEDEQMHILQNPHMLIFYYEEMISFTKW